jgi:hypothetical protein
MPGQPVKSQAIYVTSPLGGTALHCTAWHLQQNINQHASIAAAGRSSWNIEYLHIQVKDSNTHRCIKPALHCTAIEKLANFCYFSMANQDPKIPNKKYLILEEEEK